MTNPASFELGHQDEQEERDNKCEGEDISFHRLKRANTGSEKLLQETWCQNCVNRPSSVVRNDFGSSAKTLNIPTGAAVLDRDRLESQAETLAMWLARCRYWQHRAEDSEMETGRALALVDQWQCVAESVWGAGIERPYDPRDELGDKRTWLELHRTGEVLSQERRASGVVPVVDGHLVQIDTNEQIEVLKDRIDELTLQLRQSYQKLERAEDDLRWARNAKSNGERELEGARQQLQQTCGLWAHDQEQLEMVRGKLATAERELEQINGRKELLSQVLEGQCELQERYQRSQDDIQKWEFANITNLEELRRWRELAWMLLGEPDAEGRPEEAIQRWTESYEGRSVRALFAERVVPQPTLKRGRKPKAKPEDVSEPPEVPDISEPATPVTEEEPIPPTMPPAQPFPEVEAEASNEPPKSFTEYVQRNASAVTEPEEKPVRREPTARARKGLEVLEAVDLEAYELLSVVPWDEVTHKEISTGEHVFHLQLAGPKRYPMLKLRIPAADRWGASRAAMTTMEEATQREFLPRDISDRKLFLNYLRWAAQRLIASAFQGEAFGYFKGSEVLP